MQFGAARKQQSAKVELTQLRLPTLVAKPQEARRHAASRFASANAASAMASGR